MTISFKVLLFYLKILDCQECSKNDKNFKKKFLIFLITKINFLLLLCVGFFFTRRRRGFTQNDALTDVILRAKPEGSHGFQKQSAITTVRGILR